MYTDYTLISYISAWRCVFMLMRADETLIVLYNYRLGVVEAQERHTSLGEALDNYRLACQYFGVPTGLTVEVDPSEDSMELVE